MKHLDSSMEEWKSAFLAQSDETFFYIIKNYLGPVSTPYNKHTLLNKIVAYFSRSSTTERVLSLLDNTDKKILKAVRFLSAPSLTNLYSLFREDFTYLELHHRLLNLEERLLLYQKAGPRGTRTEDTAEISITPFFINLLHKRAISKEYLFPSLPLPPLKKGPPPIRDGSVRNEGIWLEEDLLLGLLSYILCHPDCIKSDGTAKKKYASDITHLFPVFSEGPEGKNRLKRCFMVCKRLHLLSPQQNTVRPIIPSWFSLATLSKYERRYYLFAAYFGPEDAELPGYTAAIETLFSNLEEEMAYPFTSVTRLLLAALLSYDLSTEHYKELISSLLELGALEEVDEGLYRKNPRLASPSEKENPPTEHFFTLESNFEITLSRETDFAYGLQIALFAEIRKNTLSPRYELHKSSLWNYFHLQYTDQDLLAFLKRHSSAPVPQNVAFSIKEWYRDYSGAGLYSGVVLVLDKERVHLIEHSKSFNKWIKKRLALGIYLLDPSEQNEWLPALKKAGLDPPPRTIRAGAEKQSGADYPLPKKRGPFPGNTNPVTEEMTTGHQSSLFEKLETLDLSKERKEELRAKVQKKLILFPEQLTLETSGGVISEAKGIDFLGKVRLIEQAIGDKNTLLEIVERTRKGEPHRFLMAPHSLEYSQGSKELFLGGKELPGGEKLHLRVRKLSLVRQVKSSLFAP